MDKKGKRNEVRVIDLSDEDMKKITLVAEKENRTIQRQARHFLQEALKKIKTDE